MRFVCSDPGHPHTPFRTPCPALCHASASMLLKDLLLAENLTARQMSASVFPDIPHEGQAFKGSLDMRPACPGPGGLAQWGLWWRMLNTLS